MSLDLVIKDINKKYKKNMISIGKEYVYNFEKVPLSSPRLNYMTYGGIPVGHIVEFFGEEGGGKTTTALDVVAAFQREFPDRKVVFIDCERTFDSRWATLIGVKMDEIVLMDPDEESAEEIFQICADLIRTGEVSLLVIDSLAAMVSQQAYEKKLTEKTYAGISQALTEFSKRAIPLCIKNKCTVLAINQLREVIGSIYGGSRTIGGKAWKHHCIIRMEFKKGSYIDEKGNEISNSAENPAGNLVQCRLAKMKAGRPDRKVGFYTLKYLTGIDYISDMIEVGLKEGVFYQAGSWISIVDTETGEIIQGPDGKDLKFQGKNNLRKFLNENEQILDEIYGKIDEIVSSE